MVSFHYLVDSKHLELIKKRDKIIAKVTGSSFLLWALECLPVLSKEVGGKKENAKIHIFDGKNILGTKTGISQVE